MELAPDATAQRVTSLTLTAKQEAFLSAVLSGDYKYLATGGAIRGGKTLSVLVVFAILMRLFPRSRWAVVREDWTALQQNTMPSIEKVRTTMGGWLGSVNHSTRTYTARNGSQLLLVPESHQQDPDLNSFKGFEVNGFALEEANELQEATFHKTIERAGAWVIPPTPEEQVRGESPEQPPPVVLLTFNPSDTWTDTVFHEPYELGTIAAPYFFLPATIHDNPHLPASYLASLEELRHAAPEQYDRFVLGKRGSITVPNQLIEPQWLVNARHVPATSGPTTEAVDVARYGDDETVFARFDGNTLVELEAHHRWNIREVSDRAALRLAEHRIDADRYVVDTVGLGAGVADNLRAHGFNVREFVAGAGPIDRPGPVSFYRFADLRSQAWWEFREQVRTGAVRLEALDPKLTKDLTAPRYEIRSDRTIRVEPKDAIKRRIGRSTDYGDAVVMAAFQWPAAYVGPDQPTTYSVLAWA